MWGLGTTLVVDDSRVYRRFLCMLLKPFSEKVLEAANPAEAIARIDADTDINLVICDMVMEGGDGLQVLEHVRARPEPRPRVVMVTAYLDPNGKLAMQGCRYPITEIGILNLVVRLIDVAERLDVLDEIHGANRRRIPFVVRDRAVDEDLAAIGASLLHCPRAPRLRLRFHSRSSH